MKKLTQIPACLPALLFLLAACMAKGGEKDKTELQKAAYGEATAADAAKAIAEAKKTATVAAGFEQLTPASGSIFTMPATGNIVAALRGNSAAWRSELYLQAGNRDIQLIADTRQGPLNKESQHAFVQGTAINFYIVVHTPAGNFRFYANSDHGRVTRNGATYTVAFEDKPQGIPGLGEPDWDFNDVVVDVSIGQPQVVDLSAHFEIAVDYLDHHGLNYEGYPIYFIGETMKYKIRLKVKNNSDYFTGKKFRVYAVHEYFADTTSNRYWYPSPPRPANEPQTISVKKGDTLPGQDPLHHWSDLEFFQGETFNLTGSYTSPLSVAAGNDQTHILIVRENEQGQIEFVVFNNPQAGVFDPPASN